MRKVAVFGSGVKTTLVPQAGDCPNCFERLDAASSLEGKSPKPGDYAVCAYCGAILIYSTALELRSVNEDDWEKEKVGLREKLEAMSRSFRNMQKAMATPDGPSTIVLEFKPKKQ